MIMVGISDGGGRKGSNSKVEWAAVVWMVALKLQAGIDMDEPSFALKI